MNAGSAFSMSGMDKREMIDRFAAMTDEELKQFRHQNALELDALGADFHLQHPVVLDCNFSAGEAVRRAQRVPIEDYRARNLREDRNPS